MQQSIGYEGEGNRQRTFTHDEPTVISSCLIMTRDTPIQVPCKATWCVGCVQMGSIGELPTNPIAAQGAGSGPHPRRSPACLARLRGTRDHVKTCFTFLVVDKTDL